jgi:hypothetical protein
MVTNFVKKLTFYRNTNQAFLPIEGSPDREEKRRWLSPSPFPLAHTLPQVLAENKSNSSYWRATYLVMSAQLAELSAVVNLTAGVTAFILTTASVLEQ